MPGTGSAVASVVCITALVFCAGEPVPIAAQPGTPSSLALRVEPEALQVPAGGDVSLKVFVRNTSKTPFSIPSIDSLIRIGNTAQSWHSPLYVDIETPESEGWTRAVFTEQAGSAPNPPQPRTIELLPGEERLLGAITLTDEKLEMSGAVTTTVSFVHGGATIRARARFVNDSPTLNGREVWSGEALSPPFTVSAAPGSIPGVRLAGSFQPERREFALGEPIFVVVEVANVGTLPVLLSDIASATAADRFSFTAVDAQERPVPVNPKPAASISAGTRILKPGELFREQVMLNQWCRFERPGAYRVRAARVYNPRPPVSGGKSATSPAIEWPLEETFEIALVDNPRAVREAENRLIAALDLNTLSLLWQPPLESRLIERLRGPLDSDEASSVLTVLNRMGRRPYVNGVMALLEPTTINQAGAAAALQAVWVDDLTEAVPWVRRLQSSAGPEIRKASAEALARLGPKARSSSLEIRPAAGQKVSPAPQSRIAPDIRLLDSLDSRERTQAAERLGALGPAARLAIPNLRKTLLDTFPQARTAAAAALARVGDAPEPSLDALIPMLTGMDSSSREAGAAVAAFGRGAEPRLREAIKSRDLRRRAIEALGLTGARDEASVKALGDALEDGDPDIRLHAVVALGRVGARAARYAPQIAQTLGQPSRPSRVCALEALGRLGDPASASRVRALIQDDDPLVREYAAAALKRLGQSPNGQKPPQKAQP